MRKRTAISLTCLVMIAAATVFAQQDPSKRPSPPGTANYKFADGKEITVEYSRPSAKGRKIFGGLVPAGEVWRTGANEATTFKTTSDLDIGGTRVPAGEYTLYTLPDQGKWKLIISKKTGQWGIPYPGEQFDLARIDMNVSKTQKPIEQFTISFENQGPNAALMKLEWENTSAQVQITEANK